LTDPQIVAVPATDEGILPARFSVRERNRLISCAYASTAGKLKQADTHTTYETVRDNTAACVGLRCEHIAAINHFVNPLRGIDLAGAIARGEADRPSLIDEISATGVCNFLRCSEPTRTSAKAKLRWYIKAAAMKINTEAGRHRRELSHDPDGNDPQIDTARGGDVHLVDDGLEVPLGRCVIRSPDPCPSCAAKSRGERQCSADRNEVAQTVLLRICPDSGPSVHDDARLSAVIRDTMRDVAASTMARNERAMARSMHCVLFALKGAAPVELNPCETTVTVEALRALTSRFLVEALAAHLRDILVGAKGNTGGPRIEAVRRWHAQETAAFAALRDRFSQ